MRRTNVEFKARADGFETPRRVLRAEAARFAGEDHQIDTYFHVPHGRLKWREGTIERHLIHYARPDASGPKRSDVLLYEPRPGEALKAVLTEALGVRVVVEKRREIYFLGNVKVHLDRVEGLGTFVEVEAIDAEGTRAPSELRAQCEHLLRRFEVRPDALVAHSYADLLLRQRGSGAQ